MDGFKMDVDDNENEQRVTETRFCSNELKQEIMLLQRANLKNKNEIYLMINYERILSMNLPINSINFKLFQCEVLGLTQHQKQQIRELVACNKMGKMTICITGPVCYGKKHIARKIADALASASGNEVIELYGYNDWALKCVEKIKSFSPIIIIHGGMKKADYGLRSQSAMPYKLFKNATFILTQTENKSKKLFADPGFLHIPLEGYDKAAKLTIAKRMFNDQLKMYIFKRLLNISNRFKLNDVELREEIPLALVQMDSGHGLSFLHEAITNMIRGVAYKIANGEKQKDVKFTLPKSNCKSGEVISMVYFPSHKRGGSFKLRCTLHPGKFQKPILSGGFLPDAIDVNHVAIQAISATLEILRMLNRTDLIKRASKYVIHFSVDFSQLTKSGPSFGFAFLAAYLSALTNVPVQNMAFTGDVDSFGNLNAIGFLAHKVMAALANYPDIKCICAPFANIDEIPDVDCKFFMLHNVKQWMEYFLRGVEPEPECIFVKKMKPNLAVQSVSSSSQFENDLTNIVEGMKQQLNGDQQNNNEGFWNFFAKIWGK